MHSEAGLEREVCPATLCWAGFFGGKPLLFWEEFLLSGLHYLLTSTLGQSMDIYQMSLVGGDNGELFATLSRGLVSH